MDLYSEAFFPRERKSILAWIEETDEYVPSRGPKVKALPGRGEIPDRHHRQARSLLTRLRRGVDLYFGIVRLAVDVEQARKDAVRIPILAPALPGDTEISLGVAGHGRIDLPVFGCAVDPELGAQGLSRLIKASSEYVVVLHGRTLAVPADDKIPHRVGSDVRMVLPARCGLIDLKL